MSIATALYLSRTIPKGDQGEQGPAGIEGGMPLNTYRVSPAGTAYQTIEEIFAHLDTLPAQTDGVRIQIDGGHYPVADTITINYPFPIYFEGSGSNATFLEAAAGLEGKPMFDIKTNAYFTRLAFEGGTLVNWYLHDSAVFIYCTADGVYVEITDFIMHEAAEGICLKSNSEVFVFNFIIEKMRKYAIGVNNNVLLSTGGALDIGIGNFVNCAVGLALTQAIDFDIFADAIRFFTEEDQICVDYNPDAFSYANFTVMNGEWNHVGTFITNVDWSLVRDADIEIQNVIGVTGSKPEAQINVTDNALTTTIVTAGTGYRVNFINDVARSLGLRMGLADNLLTYLSCHPNIMLSLVSCNVISGSPNRTIDVRLHKNGVYVNSMSVRCATAGQPYTATLITRVEVEKDDYFELFVTGHNDNSVVTVSDLNWHLGTIM